MTREWWIRTPSSPIPMDTRAFFPKSTSSHWYCLPLLSSIPEESKASFLAGFCRLNRHRSLENCGEASWNQSTHIKKEYSSKWNTHQNGILIKMEYSSKWNPHIKMEFIKMEPSYYYQNGTLLLLSKWNSSKWNTHIIIKMELIKKEHSYQNGIHQNGTLIKNGTH